MAIIKELNSSFGCSVTYHRITNISINYQVKKVTICVASYLTKEARAAKSKPLEEIDVQVPLEDFILFLDTNVIYNAYTWLKNNVIGFEDALDDLEMVVETQVIEEEKV